MIEGVRLKDGVIEGVRLLDAVIEGVRLEVGVLDGLALSEQVNPTMTLPSIAMLASPTLNVQLNQGPEMPKLLVQDCISISRLPAQVSGKVPVHSALVPSFM